MTAIPRTLESLTYRDLSKLQVEIEAAKIKRYEEATTSLKQARTKMQAELAGKLAKMAADLGVSPTAVLEPKAGSNGHRKGKAKASGVAVKFRHPKTGETWSGRGRPARWLTAALKIPGAKREDFSVGA